MTKKNDEPSLPLLVFSEYFYIVTNGKAIDFQIVNGTPTTIVGAGSTSACTVAVVKSSDNKSGTLTVASIGSDAKQLIQVWVADSGKSEYYSIVLEREQIHVMSTEDIKFSCDEHTFDITVETNSDYEITIPFDALSWLTKVETRAMRTETTTFRVTKNAGGEWRTAEIGFKLKISSETRKITIRQMGDPKSMTILFEDAVVENLCLENWDLDRDGKLSFREAEAVTSPGEVFSQNDSIKSFDELQYFTGLTSIGDNAFYNCASLQSVYCKSSTPPALESEVFDRDPSLTRIYVPIASVNAYKTATGWSNSEY